MIGSNGIFKLFNVNLLKLKEFLKDFPHATNVSCCDDEVKIEYDLSGLSIADRDKFYKGFIENFGGSIFAETDVDLKTQLFQILNLRGIKISFAESFTGGLLSSTITKMSGASNVLYEGIVCYNEISKHKRLGVLESTLKRCYPVSEDVAREMANGLLKDSEAEIAVSTTGIAGPNSDNSGFPVGLCYFGIATHNKTAVYKYKLKGNREEIINKGVKIAMFLAIKALRDNTFDV